MERANRLRAAATNALDAGDEGRCNGAKAGCENAELSARWANGWSGRIHELNLLARLTARSRSFASVTLPESLFGGRRERDRRRFAARSGLPIHEVHPLHDGDPGSDRENV